MTKLRTWALRAGITCLALGLLLSWGADFLPVDLPSSLTNLLFSSSSPGHTYYRVVPAENGSIAELALLGVGFGLIAVGLYPRNK
ncbi:hypothetical protein [Thauera sp. Sel9]|uniref:hypothetical protein n=1 Tax=Thauera sp. Sel9 TaxID=2974299 RepID=UPI0021E19959|nr:hypothetical protein [Thauera sp. Sel9]MCV2218977.1 hypothetical protein [Thauera sp. Sel9]